MERTGGGVLLTWYCGACDTFLLKIPVIESRVVGVYVLAHPLKTQTSESVFLSGQDCATILGESVFM